MTYTPSAATLTILRTVHTELSKRYGDEIPPYYDFYIDKPYDELAGKTSGTVNHEHRCPVDMHDIYNTVEFDIRIYIYPGNSTNIRSFKEDVVKTNNDEPDIPLYIIHLDLDKKYYTRDNRRFLNCPDLITGIPDIKVVLGLNKTVAFQTGQGELFPLLTETVDPVLP